MKKILLFVISVLFITDSFSQGVPAYNHYLSSGYFSEVTELTNGDMIFSKMGSPISLTRTDENGVRKWTKQLTGDPGAVWNMLTFSPTSIFILGNHTLNNNVSSIFISKVDTGGNVQWAKKLQLTNSTRAHAIIKTWDSHILVLGADSLKEILVKMDSLGNVVWSKHYFKTNYNLNGGTWGTGGLVELPDHSIAMFAHTMDMMSNSYEPIGSASFIKLDPSGNVQWVKKYGTYIPMFTIGNFSNGFWNVLHTSENSYMITLYGYRTMKVDSVGNVINCNRISAARPIRFISENPLGTLNLAAMGGTTSDFLSYEHPVFAKANLSMTSLTATEEVSPIQSTIMPGSFYEFYGVKELSDGRFAFAGKLGLGSSPVNLITDHDGQQSCSSIPDTWNSAFDTSMHAYPISIYTDTGINVTTVTVGSVADTLPHCNCDSLPTASFTFTQSGLTLSFTNTSQNATSYTWAFGDNTYDYTTTNPVHTYSNSLPTNPIVLTASNNCGSRVYKHYSALTASSGLLSPDCNGLCDGSVYGYTNSGIPPYTYSWNTIPVQNTQYATSLCAGTYVVTITDNIGQTALDTIVLPANNFSTSIVAISSPLCNGDSTGSLTMNNTGGLQPFYNAWNNDPFQDDDTVFNVPAGTYTLKVTDSTGCIANDTIQVTEPTLLQAAATSTADGGGCIGTASVVASGGVGPYTYLWSSGGTANNEAGLCGGQTYTVTTTDNNGCSRTDTATIQITLSVGITEKKETGIFPNPFGNELTISWAGTNAKPEKIKVSAINGALVTEISSVDSRQDHLTINSSKWAAGAYLITITDRSGKSIKQVKLVKK